MSNDDISTLEIILDKLREHDKEFAELREGQTDIKTQLATHEERSLNQHKRIERVEKITGGITLAMIVAIISIVLSGCGLFSGLVPPTPPPAPEPPRVDVVARAVSNTVAFHDVNGSRFCSGVASEGIIMTAAHCVDEDGFTVEYRGKRYPALVVYMDEDTDFAMVDAIGARLKGDIPLAEKPPVLGSKVIWMGYPLGQDFFMGLGYVGNTRVVVGPSHFLGVYGQFIPGNSGGPVFNYKGELIGIVSMTSTFRGGLIPLGYAVPLDVIQAAL